MSRTVSSLCAVARPILKSHHQHSVNTQRILPSRAYPSLFAFAVRLEIFAAHAPVAVIPKQTLVAPLRSLLARIVVFALGLARNARKQPGSAFWRWFRAGIGRRAAGRTSRTCGGWNRPRARRPSYLAVRTTLRRQSTVMEIVYRWTGEDEEGDVDELEVLMVGLMSAAEARRSRIGSHHVRVMCLFRPNIKDPPPPPQPQTSDQVNQHHQAILGYSGTYLPTERNGSFRLVPY